MSLYHDESANNNNNLYNNDTQELVEALFRTVMESSEEEAPQNNLGGSSNRHSIHPVSPTPSNHTETPGRTIPPAVRKQDTTSTTANAANDTNHHDELRQVRHQLTALTEAIRDQTTVMKNTRKDGQLQFALQNTQHLSPFTYYTASSRAPHRTLGADNSRLLVESILWTFRQELGYALPDGFLLRQQQQSPPALRQQQQYYNTTTTEGANERDYAGFREALAVQLHQLLGSRPRLQEEEDCSYSIWYE